MVGALVAAVLLAALPTTPLASPPASTITVTRNEVLYSLSKPEDFILALVEFTGDDTHRVHCLREPFHREPDSARGGGPTLSGRRR